MGQIIPITVAGRNPALWSALDRGVLNECAALCGSSQNHAISFGPFCLIAGQRLLLNGDRAVRLGSRAFDILIALIERRGEEVSRKELMAQVWPKTTVDPTNLTTNIFELRRALDDGQAGNRYIVNIPKRGYRFVAPVTITQIAVECQNPTLQSLVGAGVSEGAADARRSDRDRAICFGPFRLLATQRLLLKSDSCVPIGSRALDILIALLKRPGELIANCDLRDIVWPNTFVVEANLTVNMAALRRALGDGQAGNRYIVNISGRGYRFVAPVTFQDVMRAPTQCHSTAATRQPNLPTSLTGMVDRAGLFSQLANQLATLGILAIVEASGTSNAVVAVGEEPIAVPEYGRTISANPKRSSSDVKPAAAPELERARSTPVLILSASESELDR